MSLNNFEIEHEKIENEPKTEVEKKEKNDSLNINVVEKIVSIMPKISVSVKKNHVQLLTLHVNIIFQKNLENC